MNNIKQSSPYYNFPDRVSQDLDYFEFRDRLGKARDILEKNNFKNAHYLEGIEAALTRCFEIAFENAHLSTYRIVKEKLYTILSDLLFREVADLALNDDLKPIAKDWSTVELDSFYTGFDDLVEDALDIIKKACSIVNPASSAGFTSEFISTKEIHGIAKQWEPELPKLESDEAAEKVLEQDLSAYLNTSNFKTTTFEFKQEVNQDKRSRWLDIGLPIVLCFLVALAVYIAQHHDHSPITSKECPVTNVK